MYTIELSAAERRLVEAALHAYLDDFGHDESAILRELKELLARLPDASAQHNDGGHSAVTEL